MAPIHVSAERMIPARAQSLYALLADYRDGHPRILPPAFSDFRVLYGGTGEGTHIQFNVRVGGKTRRMVGQITEPEPGHILEETYEDGSVTRFTIDPVHNESRLRIETSAASRPGLAGLIERPLSRLRLSRLYHEELDMIEKWAENLGSPYR